MKTLLTIFVFALSFQASANRGDIAALQDCFAAWGKHPFNKTSPKYRKLKTSVKVMGIGKDVTDNTRTSKPDLVLIKPSVNVMTKQVYELGNPNGWYCFKANVTVMGKAEIRAHCKARIASKNDAVNVGAKNDSNAGGVTVFGKSTVTRFGCS